MNHQRERQYRAALRRKIQEYFNLAEIKVLCHELNIEYEDLAGEELANKIIEVIQYMERHERLDELIKYLKKERPDVNWEESSLLEDQIKALYVEIITKSKLDLDSEIHAKKYKANKIDMAGVSLHGFLRELASDYDLEMAKRLIKERVRLRAIFVHPQSSYLLQRSIEDDSKQLQALLNRQIQSVKYCLNFYKLLNNYYQELESSIEEVKGRVQIKLTNFCPYVSIERYDFDIFWSFYTSDTDGAHNPMLLATFEENYHLFDKLRKHYSQLMNGRFNDETQNLYLVTMGVGGPCLNRDLAEDLLGKEVVASIIDQ